MKATDAYEAGAAFFERSRAEGMSSAEAMKEACRVVRIVMREIGSTFDETPMRRLPSWVSGVVADICKAHQVPVARLLSRDRATQLVPIRWEIAAELRRRGLSLPQIGVALNRDHSSILHGLRKHGATTQVPALRAA